MKSLPVGEFKAQFSDVIEEIKKGRSVGLLYGKQRRPIARLVPEESAPKKNDKRKLGLLNGKMKVVFAPDFKMTEEEFVNLGKK